MDDLYNDPDSREWAKNVREDMVPKMRESSIVVNMACDPDNVDPKFAVELGYSIMMNKPIIGVIKPGMQISEKFCRVVDRFVEMNTDDPEGTKQAITDAIKEITEAKDV